MVTSAAVPAVWGLPESVHWVYWSGKALPGSHIGKLRVVADNANRFTRILGEPPPIAIR